MRLTLTEVAEASGGRVLAGAPGATVTSTAVDSRRLEPGALFVALKGARDGHDFVAHAFDRGAAAALVEREVEVPPGRGAVMAGSTRVSLVALAEWARARLGDKTVVGITGSTGKTSTKDLMAAALMRRYRVCASPASYNNEIGVPLTLLSADERTDVVVAELGARARDQIRELAGLVRHRVGVVTAVGPVHTEMFGSEEQVAVTKAELLETLPQDGLAVLWVEHRWAGLLAERAPARVLRVGSRSGVDVRVGEVSVDECLRPTFTLDTPWGTTTATLGMRGAHQAQNAALAAAVALELGVSLDEVVAGLGEARGSSWRMEVEPGPGGVLVVNDAYNANPMSMAAALSSLADLDVPGRRWAVLGEMAELGTLAAAEHRRAGRIAVEAGVDRLVVVGERAVGIAEGARAARAARAGMQVVEVPAAESALGLLRAELEPGDAVLVKASRVVALERVAEALVCGDDARGAAR